jgi:hypothetical protein
MKLPDFRDILKIGKLFFFSSGIKGLLLTTGFRIASKIFRLPYGPPLELSSSAQVEMYCYIKVKLVVLCD